MTEKEWHNKEGKVVRKSTRRGGKKCNRPFTAPRRVVQDSVESEIQEIAIERLQETTSDDEDKRVRPMYGPFLNPYPEGIKSMSEREADECARHGDVLRWSSDDELLDILKSPEPSEGRVPGAMITDNINDYVIEASPTRQTYQGVNYVQGTEIVESSVQSSDERPVVTSLRNRQKITLSLQQITDCQEGPKGDRAIGVSIAKSFGDYEYRGTVDKFRGETRRFIYHVTYTDGDEEELSQKELRDCYILALAPDIEAQWTAFKKTKTEQNMDKM
jgi:hypothetical protein